MRLQLLSSFALVLLLAGCASVPAPLQGDYSEAFYPEQTTDRSVGARVRWGGTIVETLPGADQTCVEILSRSLDRSYRPEVSDASYGRFIACRDQFLDPEIFVNGRDVTVTGRIEGFDSAMIGEFEYQYPRLDSDSIYLWPERAVFDDRVYYNHFPVWPYYYRSRYIYHSPYYYPGRGKSRVHGSGDRIPAGKSGG